MRPSPPSSAGLPSSNAPAYNSPKYTSEGATPSKMQVDAPDFVPSQWQQPWPMPHFTHAGFQPTMYQPATPIADDQQQHMAYGMPYPSTADLQQHQMMDDPMRPLWPAAAHAAITSLTTTSPEEEWTRTRTRSRMTERPATPQISQAQLLQVVVACKDSVAHDLQSDWKRAFLAYLDNATPPDIYASPFSHCLGYFILPPPRMRYIHPSITDAALYALRNPKEDRGTSPTFELTTTRAPGFENAIRSDWLIAVVALFYYGIPPLRLLVAGHSCSEVLCWMCELSFVFRALDICRAEGRGQPVRMDRFCEALMRSAPTTLELQVKDSSLEAEYNRALPGDRPRLITQIRRRCGARVKRPWLRIRSSRRGDDLHSQASPHERRRERIAQTIRKSETEKKNERQQRRARTKLHSKVHLVLNYFLHSLGSNTAAHEDLFCIDMETTTECRLGSALRHRSAPERGNQMMHTADGTRSSSLSRSTAARETVKSTPTYILELDHDLWTQYREHLSTEPDSNPPAELSSGPVSTAESFVSSAPQGERGEGSASSASCDGDSQSVDVPVHLTPRQTDCRPWKVSFCDLLRASLWKSMTVNMTCKQCEPLTSRTTSHIVSHRVKQLSSLPAVLAIKVRLADDTEGGQKALGPLRFWRGFNRSVSIPGEVSPRSGRSRFRGVSTFFPKGTRGDPDDDTDMMRLVKGLLNLRDRTRRRPSSHTTARHLNAMTDAFKRILDPELSPLPNRVIMKLQSSTSSSNADHNPWRVVEVKREDRIPSDWLSYELTGVIVSVNHLYTQKRRYMLLKLWMNDILPTLKSEAGGQLKDEALESILQRIEAEEIGVEAPPDQDQLISYIRQPGGAWLMVNGPAVCEVSELEVRHFCVPWKYPCALFYAQISRIWSSLGRLPPPPPPLPPTVELFADESVSQLPYAMRQHPRFCPLAADEIAQVQAGGFLVAMDAEHVVLELLKKSPNDLFPGHPCLALGRMSLLRANGGPSDTQPFLDHYALFRDEPFDYCTEYSGLYPGDLDLSGSTHWLATQKHIYQVMRYLVENRCRFIGHDLFNDFRVLGLIVPASQIIDTVEIFRKSLNSRFLSLRFVCYHVLHQEVQRYTHDSIEDARAALALYRYYLHYVSDSSHADFHSREVERLYKIGYQTNFKVQPIQSASTSAAPPDQVFGLPGPC